MAEGIPGQDFLQSIECFIITLSFHCNRFSAIPTRLSAYSRLYALKVDNFILKPPRRDPLQCVHR